MMNRIGSVPRPSSRWRCDPDADPDLEADAGPDDDWVASEALSFRGRALEEELGELEGLEELEELDGLEEEAALPSARGPAAEASSVVISFFSLRSSARWSAAPTGTGSGRPGRARGILPNLREVRAAEGPAGWSAGAG
jgi:hypothetical protein